MRNKLFMLILLSIIAGIAMAACDTLLESFQQTDSQSATLTAMVTPTSLPPTLDLKGNNVLELPTPEPYEVVCVSIIEDRIHGGLMEWADDAPIFAYVAPANRYWGWFSGDAVVLDFSDESKVPDEFGNIPEGFSPYEISTTDLHVFGDFGFSPDHSKLAFTALRQSEKLYTVFVADYASGLKNYIDLFPDTAAETDQFASDKSVIEWVNNNTVRVASSCGIDCERIYSANVRTGQLTFEEEVRKHGHSGREQENHVIEYDDRLYPVMNNANWSPNEDFVFYTDARYQTWIIRENTKEQYMLPVDGRDVLQTRWSADSRFIAIRFEDSIEIYEIQ